MAYKGFLIIVMWGIIHFCQAQNFSVLTQAKILELQRLPIREITARLTKEGWRVTKNQQNQLGEYFQYDLGYKVDLWEQKGKVWNGIIYICYRQGYPNMIIVQTSAEIFNNLKPTYIQSIKEDKFEIAIIIKYGLAMEFRDYYNESSSKKFSILLYDIGSVKTLISEAKRQKEKDIVLQKEEEKKEKEEEKKKQISLTKDDQTGKYILTLQKGDEFFGNKDYKNALFQYRLAKKYLLPSDTAGLSQVDLKIEKSRNELNILLAGKYVEEADSLLKENKFREALAVYENSLRINANDNYVVNKIHCLKEYFSKLETAKTEQSYQNTNREDYSFLLEKNYNALNSLMKFASGEGYLNYSINISFDTDGNNLSSINIDTISDEKFMFYLSDLNVNSIPPARIYFACISQSINIPSNDTLKFRLKWNSQQLSTTIKNNQINIDQKNSLLIENKVFIDSFFKSQKYKNGIYKFEITKKELNNKILEDLKLVDFVDESVFGKRFHYFLVPGLRTYKMTDHERGKGRMISFIVSAAVSIGSSIYSNIQFNKYKNPLNANNNREKYYNRANTSNKISLFSGGTAVSIYLYDISSFLIKGFKTKERNSVLNEELKNGPILLKESSFKPY